MRLEVRTLRRADAEHHAVIAAFARRGVHRLPALFADGQAYVGCAAIADYYGRRTPPNADAPPGNDLAGDDAEGALAEFMRNEIAGPGAEVTLPGGSPWE